SVCERSISEGFRSPAPTTVNLDFEARVPVPFSVFPSTYQEAETQTQVDTTTTTTTTTEQVEFAPPRPEAQQPPAPRPHQQVECHEDKFKYTREEEDGHRPERPQSERHERHYYTEEYR